MSRTELPESHLQENEKLIADAYVQLYEIRLRNGTYLTLKNNNTVNWQGVTWTGIAILFEGYQSASADQLSRPSLQIVNPDGAFSTFIRDGLLNRSIIKRYTVLYDDLINNRNIYQERKWVCWNVKSLNKNSISLELRNPMDGVNFNVPARLYIPPEFPSVQLK